MWFFAWPASYFLLLVQKKVTKENDTPTAQPAKKTAGSLVARNLRGR